MISDKKELRKQFRLIRSEEKSEVKDEIIYRKLTSLPEFINAETVFLYYSYGSEVGTTDIIDFCLKNGKRVALPKCLDKCGRMEFYLLSDGFDSLDSGMYGIYEPDSESCSIAESDEKSVCIVPGLAFDKGGYRLGYGKGYYDRFLVDFKGLTVGLCYEKCLCDELPYDEYDCKIQTLITEHKIYFLNKEEYIYGR